MRTRLALAGCAALLLGVLPANADLTYNGWDLGEAERALGARSQPRLEIANSAPAGNLQVRIWHSANPATPPRAIAYLGGGTWLVDDETGDGVPLPALAKIDRAFESVLDDGAPSDITAIVLSTRMDAEVEAGVLASGAEITNRPLSARNANRLGITIRAAEAADVLRALAELPFVYSIEPASGARLLNDNANSIVQSGIETGDFVMWDRGLTGEGSTIAVLDTGLDYSICYFEEGDASLPPLNDGLGEFNVDPTRRKVVAYTFLWAEDFGGATMADFDNHGHGTWVSGNALGARIDAPLSRVDANGIAPGARIIVQDGGFDTFDDCADLVGLGCPVVDLTPHLDHAVALGADIHNNSWGDRENFFPHNTYTPVTADMDDAVWRNPDFVITVAAGNNANANGAVISPSVGKNVLSVGATDSPSAGGTAENLASFSSVGGASDGRIKPDLTAPGRTDTAAWQSGPCGTLFVQGTSMASPVAAGCAAIVREYFLDGYYPTGAANAGDGMTPSAALVKAVLLNGCVDMAGVAGPPPNTSEGWGRINLENSLYFTGDARRVLIADERTGFSTAGDPVRSFFFEASGNAAAGDIRVTLVWTDPAASPAATTALVNDLDLSVTEVGATRAPGDTYTANVFDASGFTPANTGTADDLNNVEMVILPATTTGVFRADVSVANLPVAGQGFALVIGGDVTDRSELAGVDDWRDVE